ncbi:MAG: nucleoside phosphorylase [Candidatus Promineifilaceae bacterium]
MDELFTPRATIEHFVERRGIRVEDIGVAPFVIVSWGHRVIEQMATRIGARRSENWLYGERQPFFTGELEGKALSLVEMPVGAPGTVMIMEELIACGAKSFIGLGWAGSLQPEASIGSFFIPTSCISEEGTSAHYLDHDTDLRADPNLAEALEIASSDEGVLIRKGPQWTTDAPYRELREKVKLYREVGVLGVDMETLAMYALASFRGIKVCNLLVVSDVLDREWQLGFGTTALKRANEIAQRVVLRSIFAS